jgi:hypothetical protein
MMVFLFFLGFSPAGADTVMESAGIRINSTTGELIEGDVSDSDWYSDLFNTTDGILALIGLGGAIIVGFFTRQFDWKIALLPFFTVFVRKFVAFGWAIVDLARQTGEVWLIGVVATIFLPLTAMFIVSIVNWFGGSQ